MFRSQSQAAGCGGSSNRTPINEPTIAQANFANVTLSQTLGKDQQESRGAVSPLGRVIGQWWRVRRCRWDVYILPRPRITQLLARFFLNGFFVRLQSLNLLR